MFFVDVGLLLARIPGMPTLRERIGELREAKGLSRRQLSIRASLHPNYLSRIDRGERGPNASTTYKIAKALGLDDATTAELIHLAQAEGLGGGPAWVPADLVPWRDALLPLQIDPPEKPGNLDWYWRNVIACVRPLLARIYLDRFGVEGFSHQLQFLPAPGQVEPLAVAEQFCRFAVPVEADLTRLALHLRAWSLSGEGVFACQMVRQEDQSRLGASGVKVGAIWTASLRLIAWRLWADVDFLAAYPPIHEPQGIEVLCFLLGDRAIILPAINGDKRLAQASPGVFTEWPPHAPVNREWDFDPLPGQMIAGTAKDLVRSALWYLRQLSAEPELWARIVAHLPSDRAPWGCEPAAMIDHLEQWLRRAEAPTKSRIPAHVARNPSADRSCGNRGDRDGRLGTR